MKATNPYLWTMLVFSCITGFAISKIDTNLQNRHQTIESIATGFRLFTVRPDGLCLYTKILGSGENESFTSKISASQALEPTIQYFSSEESFTTISENDE